MNQGHLPSLCPGASLTGGVSHALWGIASSPQIPWVARHFREPRGLFDSWAAHLCLRYCHLFLNERMPAWSPFMLLPRKVQLVLQGDFQENQPPRWSLRYLQVKTEIVNSIHNKSINIDKDSSLSTHVCIWKESQNTQQPDKWKKESA